MRLYLDHFAALDPVVSALEDFPPGRPVQTTALVSGEAYFASDFYRDWLAPQVAARDGGAVMLPVAERRGLVFRVHFAQSEAEIAQMRLMERFDAAASYLYGALRVHRGASGQRARSLGLDALLESTRTALFIIDAASRPIEMHGPTRMLMDRGVLRLDDAGVIRFRDEVVVEMLDRAQAASRAGEEYTDNATLTIDADGTTVILTVVALGQTARWAPRAPWEEPVNAALAVSTVSRALPVSATSERYALSRAEMDVLNGLIEGKSAKRLAEERGTSVHTVRNQVTSLLTKTRTSSQKELIALFTRAFPG